MKGEKAGQQDAQKPTGEGAETATEGQNRAETEKSTPETENAENEANTEPQEGNEEHPAAGDDYQTPHPEGITSLCYSCTEYETCNVKTGTCTKCDQYKNRVEAYKNGTGGSRKMDEREMKRKHVTDLRPWFTESLKMSNIVTGVWLILDNMKKQLIVKFNEEMSGMERMAYLRRIGQSLMTTAAEEDAKEGGESGFGNFMDMMQLREWRKEDEETIRNGIPHDMEQ